MSITTLQLPHTKVFSFKPQPNLRVVGVGVK